jgi:uncharacterized membrane protein
MISSIEQYLAELKKELSGCDRAVIQDALSDAEEYLRMAVASAAETEPGQPPAAALAAIVARYGAPVEVAAAYKDLEERTSPAFSRPAYKNIPPPAPAAVPVPVDKRPFYVKFFGVFAEPRAWGSLFYLLFALATGIIYFTWVVTGLSVSAGLSVLIIGIPFFFLFLLSVRGIALVEGRLIEALFGVRMPRRPLFTRKDLGFWQKLKGLFTQRQTWTAMVYMVLQLPLGIIYFTVAVTLVSVSIWLIGRPIFELFLPAFVISPNEYYTAGWAVPLVMIGGALLLTATMHLVKYVGRLHGHFAKAMLVSE